jgi:hypothetical protein
MKQSADFDTHIQGIPCGIKVLLYRHQDPWRGSAHTCPSSEDYYGYTDFEYVVLDSKGYEADWLRNKMTTTDEERILTEYKEYLNG